MKHLCLVFLFFIILGNHLAFSQVSPDCGTAIPICNNTPVNGGTNGFGSDDFNGAVESGCLEETLSGSIESNSAWYRFRTGASGQLGFNIGIDTAEDWDFALYQTNDCNNLGDPIRCEFFDNQDEDAFIGVGEDPTGNIANIQYDTWLDVSPGEDYYLFINNFSNINSGFTIQFSGHIFVTNPDDALDCTIINNLLGPPISACEGDIIDLDATTIGATYAWFSDIGSGSNLIPGETNATLQVTTSALYSVRATTSSETFISDVQVVFSAVPTSFPVTDDASCSGTSTYDLSVKDAEALGSQDPGAYIVSYHQSQADAMNGIQALPKLYATGFGSETISVRVTSISNPRCFDASQQFQLTALETPELNFPTEAYICEDANGITIGETMPNPGYTYAWDTGETTSSIVVMQAGVYTLSASNTQSGLTCSSSRAVAVVISRPPVISDIIVDDLQTNNTVTLVLEEEGDFEFRLDDGQYQKQNKWSNVVPGLHTVTINDLRGCGVVTEDLVVVGFPKFFTPNGDGSNARWHIAGISNLESPIVLIYNRYGKLLKELTNQTDGWDGTFNNKTLPATDYWFKLTYMGRNGERSTAKHIDNHFSLKR